MNTFEIEEGKIGMGTLLRGLIFDVDGTIADTELTGHLPAFNQAFEQHGIPIIWSVEEYRELYRFPSGLERIRYELAKIRHDDVPSERFMREVHRTKTNIYQQRLRDGLVPLRPGVGRLLREAHLAGIKLGIVTTSRADSARILIQIHMGNSSLSWFDVILGEEDGYPLKPNPEMYLKALDIMELSPHHVVAVEDSAAGVKAARKALLPTLITVNEFTRTQDFDGGLAILENLGEKNRPARRWDSKDSSDSGVVVTLPWIEEQLQNLHN